MPTCFVILPFGNTIGNHTEEYWTNHYTQFIKPAIEKASDGQRLLGFQAVRANPPGGGIVENVFRNLQSADVVLADLTDFNPNVIYELAFRQCLHDSTIMIIEKEREFPFYFKNYSIITYSKDSYTDADEFKEKLQHRLLELTHSPTDPSDNPISDYFRKTGQSITTIGGMPDLPTLRTYGFSAIYIPEVNDLRNTRKRQILHEARQGIDLLASSGYSYLIRFGSRFRSALEERLRAKVPVRIILLSPWSERRILLTLNELSETTPPLTEVQTQALENMEQGNFSGFDPVSLIEQSNHYKFKYLPSIQGYKELHSSFGDTIQLRVCTIFITATILLTEASGFFEPYIDANLQLMFRLSGAKKAIPIAEDCPSE
jgi:hypothetical protein